MTRYITTLEIIKDYFAFRLNSTDEVKDPYQNISKNCRADCKFVRPETYLTIRKLALKAECEHRESFDCYLNKMLFETKILMDENCETKILNQIKEIANMVFDDNCINWGRIVIIISFLAYLSFRYSCKVNSISKASSLACKLIEWLTSFITCKYGIWIECNGGWEKLSIKQDNSIFNMFYSFFSK
ncbi:apoptosis regulator BAX-like [Brachionus plicatilis]|uniref:Apoptosis regulator BAX-like n=1 Tax=Brachionus plicatilis TaxID=10195 RepID=A0A3M7S936_BRAPC|nr:apoptosis regulator BAX-like [Brachionus plicatilis]